MQFKGNCSVFYKLLPRRAVDLYLDNSIPSFREAALLILLKLKQMIKHIKYTLIVFLLIYKQGSFAQTTNTGQLIILTGTEVSIEDDFTNTSTSSLINNGEISIFKNFTNNGVLSYSIGNTTSGVHFTGTTQQIVAGSQPSVFYTLFINNSTPGSAINLTGNIHVFNLVNFNQGIVENNSGAFIFEENSNHINTSDISYVNGIVQKIGDTTFEFPIGDGQTYKKLKISAPASTSDVFSAQYIKENSNALYAHSSSIGIIEFIETKEYWTLTRDQGNSDVVLTLPWDENTNSTELFSGLKTAIHIVRWDASKGFWVDEGGIVDEVNKTVSTIASITDFGVFSLAKVQEDFILPGGLVIYNFLTPNNDGKNDFFRIEGIESVLNNTLQIFNRWGVKVYGTKNYNSTSNVFKGYSDGRATLSRGEQLPSGTYYYIFNYEYNSQQIKKAGYLYINGKN